MKTITFAKRCFKEIIRDPLSIIFSIILPLLLLFIFTQINIPSSNYKVDNLTPGIVIFSFSFITLFTTILVAKDRSTFLLVRLQISSIKMSNYIFGYIISILPIIIIQNFLIYLLAIILNLNITIGIFFAILSSIPISILFITLGIIIGTLVSDKAAAGVSSIIVQLVSFTSEMYFDASMLSKTFNTICNILPFSACVELLKSFLNYNFDNLVINILKVSIYLAIFLIFSCILFKKRLIK